MNAMNDDPKPENEPEIIMVGFDRKAYYLVRGDEHLSQILLADGTFPTPIHCIHFNHQMDVRRVMGFDFDTSEHWGVHPEIVERLRNTNCLVETDAPAI